MAGGDDKTSNGGDVEGLDVAALKTRVLTDPGVVSMMSNKLNSLVGMPSHYIAALPTEVKQRIKALKKLQVDYLKLNGEFYKEAAALENKYFAKYNELFSKRNEITTGKHEPSEEECEYKETNADLATDLAQASTSTEAVTGIPSFWLTCMKNAIDGTNDFITEEDEPILEHLTDVVIEDGVDSFKLHFHFSPNDFFSNAVLTKEFKLKLSPTEEDPFNFDGPEIIAMKGMKIDWKSDDKDVTQKKVTKKQKNKKTGVTRTVVKSVQTDSFFNFFNKTEWVNDSEDMEEELAEAFHTDTNLGSFFRERLIPRAVLYFTGEMTSYDEDYDEEIDEGLDDADEAAGSDADPDYKPSKKDLRKVRQQAAECKQQ